MYLVFTVQITIVVEIRKFCTYFSMLLVLKYYKLNFKSYTPKLIFVSENLSLLQAQVFLEDAAMVSEKSFLQALYFSRNYITNLKLNYIELITTKKERKV
jgi:hypothetical protein